MQLAVLFQDLPIDYHPEPPGDVFITGIAIDTRKVNPGDVFVALKGGTGDGHDFIPEAVEAGAVAVIGDQPITGLLVPYIQVENSRRALSWLAAAYYGHPGRELTVIGVTGTDGKTTTCNLLYQILRTAGIRTGMISTVNALIGEDVLDTGFHVTTPDAPDLQRYLAKMVETGLTHVILETTSHGLSQHRVDACEYDVAVVTNITHEHLDEHGSYDSYLMAKARLFQLLGETGNKKQGNPRLAVLNRDDTSFAILHDILESTNKDREIPINEVIYSLNDAADIRAESIRYTPEGINFNAIVKGLCIPVSSPLVGEFNVSNCLAAMAVTLFGLGVSAQQTTMGIVGMAGVPGRMERIDLGQEFTAIVDFAHTPNSLRVALITARRMLQVDHTRDKKLAYPYDPLPLHEPRVITVFGSAGLRDREKRRMMAKTATEFADFSIFTAEDPRTENLMDILQEMAHGAREKGGEEGRNFVIIPDRGEAIRQAVRMARRGDIVLACGKGHEQSMCFGTVEHPWDDRVAMRVAVADLLGIDGPKMPTLPTQNRSD